MSTKQIADELIELVQQSREYVSYFGELGAETIAMTEARETPPPATPSSPRASIMQAASPKVAETSQPPRPAQPAPADSLFADITTTEVSPPQSTETLPEIWSDIGECTRCALCAGRTQVVNTHGNLKARLMFVGEAPGADEDAQGKPFVGRAGQLLTKMIEAMGMKREEVIIGNVNRCRPPGNRQPTLEEAAICRPFLFREIASIQPEVIVVMGNTALRNLLEVREGITRVRGNFQDFRGIKVMPTFHPAYLLRDPSKKRETWDDLKKVMDYLDSNSRKSSA